MKEYDLTILFPKDKQGIHTNANFLAKESPVFQKLIFEDPLKPKTEITIDDDPAVAYHALRCLHTLGRSLSSVNVAAVIRNFGTKYQIVRLCVLCEKFVMTSLKPHNAAEIHDLACHYVWRSIQYCCWLMFDMSWKGIFSDPSFYNCDASTIMRFVTRPIYIDLNEFFIWNAVYTWGLTKVLREKSTHNLLFHREILNSYLPYIRFLTMKKEELNSVFRSNILSVEECRAIKEAYENHDVSNLPPTLCRSTVPRTATNVEEQVSHIRSHFCIKHTIVRWVKANDIFFSEFTVSNDCFVIGIVLPLRIHVNPSPVLARLELSKTHMSNGKKENGSRTLQLFSHAMNLFPPVFVEKNCKVSISVVMTNDSISWQIEPYASCHIGRDLKDACENAEEWKHFYITDVIVYF